MDLPLNEQHVLNKMIDIYKTLEPFIKKYKRLSYVEFDYLVVHELTLFTIEPDFSFETLDKELNLIINALPAIKRIFSKPSIHLKEQSVILPTESVRIINNNTIQHIASHSELWTDVKKDEIKPSKLLTKTYDDDYGIYENLVFCKVVDDILAFARKNQRILKEMVYTSQTIELNLLERVNHLNYFLALGKLHTGYNRNFDSYYAISIRCLNKIQFILGNITPRLKQPVYKNNKKRPIGINVHKTNILSMHRDYHEIYKLSKYFALHYSDGDKEITSGELQNFQNNYYSFCELLTIFAISHFNFSYDSETLIDFARLNINFNFKNWRLNLKKAKCGSSRILIISIKSDKLYKIALVPSISNNNDKLLNEVKKSVAADELLVCSPYEIQEDYAVNVSITDIESFRRLQQVILRGMVYSDKKRQACPFCTNKLSLDEGSLPDRLVYKCVSCRTEIHTGYCPDTGKTYPFIKITGLRNIPVYDNELWLLNRKRESQMFFRNITNINDYAEIICPYCNNTH